MPALARNGEKRTVNKKVSNRIRCVSGFIYVADLVARKVLARQSVRSSNFYWGMVGFCFLRA